MTNTVQLLDDPATVERFDRSGLLACVDALPDDCEAAWQRWQGFELPAAYAGVSKVVLLGMGGSAIAADVLRAIAGLSSSKPVHVVRAYELPAFVDASTLVIACSHSGNTEETLAAYEAALRTGAPTAVVATRGTLLDLARANGAPAIVYDYAGQPRSAIGHQLMALLAIGRHAGLLPAQDDAVAEAASLMRQQRGELGMSQPANRNAAKQLALRLVDRLPVVIGAGVLSVAAYRWKTQFNENSKVWALREELPELDHNTIVGFELPKAIVLQMHAVFLGHADMTGRLKLRYDGTADALSDAGVSSERVDAQGSSALAQALTAIYYGDWVSYYLALLNGVDPSTVVPIEKLKQRLGGG